MSNPAIADVVDGAARALRVGTPGAQAAWDVLAQRIERDARPVELAWLHIHEGGLAFFRGDLDRVHTLVDHALAALDVQMDDDAWLAALNLRAGAYMRAGAFPRAVTPLTAQVHRARKLGGHQRLTQAAGNLAYIFTIFGDTATAMELYREALAVAPDLDATGGLAGTLLREGRIDEAMPYVTSMRALAQAAGAKPHAASAVLWVEAELALAEGRTADCLVAVDGVVAEAKVVGIADQLVGLDEIRIDALIGEGLADEAWAACVNALEAPGGSGCTAFRLRLLELQSRLAEGRGDLQAALGAAREAAEVSQQITQMVSRQGLRALTETLINSLEHLRHVELAEANDALRHANEEARQARDAAERAAEARHGFLSRMSHEIRTPLNGVIAAAQLLCEARLPPHERELVGIIRDSGDLTLAIVDDVLDLGKLDAGRLDLDPVPFALARTVELVASLQRARADEKGVVIRVDIAETVPQWVRADDRRLQQILLNLVGNAVKFTDEGEVLIAVRPSPGGVRFQVVDSGEGIPAAALPTLFDPYVQAGAGVARRRGGSGLGLAIVAGLVDAFGGTLQAASKVGVGSTFTVDLPLEAVSAPAGASSASGVDALPADLRVLVVEDNLVNQKVLSWMLEGLGVRVEVAEDGEAGLERAANGAFDVVLLDHHLPGMTGLDVARRLHAIGVLTPLISLTASALPEDRRASEAAGIAGFLTKPVRRDQIVTAILSAVA